MPKSHDLKGRTFGQLIVLNKAPSRISSGGAKRAVWNCQCDCGNQKEILANSLLTKRRPTTHCGCSTNRHKLCYKVFPGDQFGFLTVLKRLGSRKPGGPHYHQCQCVCGQITEVHSASLLHKKRPIRSCGCINTSSDSFESLANDSALAASSCFIYLVEVAGAVDKIGITVNPDSRKYSGQWTEVWWQTQLSRAECWAVEQVALFLTKGYKPENPVIIKDSCGASEQRTGWVLDDVISLLQDLVASCQTLGWQTFYQQHLCLT